MRRRSLRLAFKSKHPDEDLGKSFGGDSTRKRSVSAEKDVCLNEDKENGGGIGGDDGGMGQSAGGEIGFDKIKIEKGVRVLEVSDGIGKPEKGSAGKSFGEMSGSFVGLGGEQEPEVEKERLRDLDELGFCLEIGDIGQKVKKAKGKVMDNLNAPAGKKDLKKRGLVEDYGDIREEEVKDDQECSKDGARKDVGKGNVTDDDLVCYGVGEEKLDMNWKHHKSSGLTVEGERGIVSRRGNRTGESTQGSAVVEDLEDNLVVNENAVHERILFSQSADSYGRLEPDVKEVVDVLLLMANDRATRSQQVAYTLTAESENLRRRQYARQSASWNARSHAHYQSAEERKYVSVEVKDKEDIKDLPGPFSTAIKIIEDRKKIILQGTCSNLDKSICESIMWVPKARPDNVKHPVPSLLDLCSVHLAKYVDAIVSLEGVPDFLRNRLSQFLIDSRSMNTHIFKLFLRGSPGEIRLKNCSWLPEEEFSNLFQGFDASNLTVLHLNQCGRCLPDYLLSTTLAKSSNSFPALISLSVSGACRLSDDGLNILVSSNPALSSINLSQCSLLSSSSIDSLSNSLGLTLRELYLDDWQNFDVNLMLPALTKLEQLEVLSLAGIENVTDAFIQDFMSVRGHNMKELVLSKCVNLTNNSLKFIADHCSGLRALDIMNLRKLTDNGLRYLANGCPSIQKFNLCQNRFSDESIAAFVEILGDNLKELSLNKVKKVGISTALSLAKCSKNLHILDLSFCLNLSEEALGLIVDSCLSLRMLKVFGCSQITIVFVEGHSNPKVKITGLSSSLLFENLPVIEPYDGPLRYYSVD